MLNPSSTGTHRDQIEAVIRDHGQSERRQLPDYLRNPTNAHEFDLAMALLMHDMRRREGFDGGPIYDADGLLTGWRGIKLREEYQK